MAKIKSISAHMIFDSRGTPTVEALVSLDDGSVAVSAVPSGASTGSNEAVELRDNNESEWNGKGVKSAINNVNTVIAQALIGMEATSQQDIDKKMISLDGTPNKSKLGGNAILPVSQAVAKAAAISSGLSLPVYIKSLLVNPVAHKVPTPMFNVIGGGLHANNGLNFQEFLIIPASSKTFDEKLAVGISVYKSLKSVLLDKSMSTGVSDEGGYSPDVSSNIEALNLIKTACDKSQYKFSLDVFTGLDCAATSFFGDRDKRYKLMDKPMPLSQSELAEYYKTIFSDFGILYFEDPFAENDLEGWKLLSDLVTKTMITGDDLTTTNPLRLQMAIDNGLINSIIIKPNQIGTITETLAVIEMARFKNIKIVVSHRSGETWDDFIADFALGVGADYVKFGAPSHERIYKYNRIMLSQGLV